MLRTLKFSVLVFAPMCLVLTECKPRNNSSGLTSAESAMKMADEIESRLLVISERSKSFQVYPVLNESVLSQASKDGGKINLLSPRGCDKRIWDHEIVWKNDFLEFLVTEARKNSATEKSYYEVRLKAISTLADLGRRHGILCWEAMVNELLQNLDDRVPNEKMLRNSDQKNRKWTCSSFLHCSQAIETSLVLTPLARDSEQLFDFMKRIRDDILALEFAPALTDILDIRVNSMLAFRSFMIETNLLDESLAGSNLLPDNKKLSFLQEWYDELIAQYDTSLARLNSETRFNAIVRPQIYDQLISKELFEDTKSYEQLTDKQKEFITGYVASIVQTATITHESNHGIFEYIDRLRNRDPRPWLNKLVKRVALFRAIGNAQEWSASQDGNISDDVKKTIYQQQEFSDLRLGVSSDTPLNPLYAFKSLTTFMKHEVFLPYRADFVNTIRQVFQMMTQDQQEAMSPDLRTVAALVSGYRELFQNYSFSYAGVPNKGEPLVGTSSAVVEEAQRMFSRLLQRETEIANAPGMQSFQSIHYEFLEYSRRMLRRTIALNSYFSYWKDEGQLVGFDKLVSPRERKELYRMFFAPGTGGDELKFNLDSEHFNLISQWIAINCLDRMFSGTNDLRFSKKFFLDGTPIDFQCRAGEALVDLKMRALKYTSGLSYDKTYQALWQSVRDNPFLHAAEMLILSSTIGPLGGKIFQLIGGLGSMSFVPTVFQTVWAARLITASRLICDSYIFGVAEYYAGQGLDSVFGIKHSSEEQSLHSNPFTNLTGVFTGAIIFGMIPQAHHGADYLAKASLGRFIKREWAMNVSSALAQYGAETALFTWNPLDIGVQKATELYKRSKGEYHEASELENLLINAHGKSTAQNLLKSMIVAGAFNVHRFAGSVIHSSGLPTNITNELAYFGVRSLGALRKRQLDQSENLYETLNVSRNATDADIMFAYKEHQKALISLPKKLSDMGMKLTDRDRETLNERFLKVEGAVAILLGRPGWGDYATKPERDYLKVSFGNPRIQHDKKIYGNEKQKFKEGDHDYIPAEVPDLRSRANDS